MTAYPTIIIAEIASSAHITGVNRHVRLLLDALETYSGKVYYLRFEHSRTSMFVHEEDKGHYVQLTIPMPINIALLMSGRYRLQGYLDVIFPSIRHAFFGRVILHMHTINLIDLAIKARNVSDCKVLLHLHCIPWRGLYNSDRERFAYLSAIDKENKRLRAEEFAIIINEIDAYRESNHVICVSHSGQAFLQKLGIPLSNTSVIYNGLPDALLSSGYDCARDYKLGECPMLIFVGNANKSKGLQYLLDALCMVRRQGYDFKLLVAGQEDKKYKIRNVYPTLTIDFLGNVDYATLCKYYSQASIGVIASLQEQCSYAAIEMMMHALPIISTSAEGLSEMLTDAKESLIVPIIDDEDGLRPDIRVVNDSTLSFMVSATRQYTIEPYLFVRDEQEFEALGEKWGVSKDYITYWMSPLKRTYTAVFAGDTMTILPDGEYGEIKCKLLR